MMIVGRGVAGFGAGGEYPVCGTNACEASDESQYVRKRRGILVAISTDFAIDLVCENELPTCARMLIGSARDSLWLAWWP